MCVRGIEFCLFYDFLLDFELCVVFLFFISFLTFVDNCHSLQLLY
jgi:hypothetical protein